MYVQGFKYRLEKNREECGYWRCMKPNCKSRFVIKKGKFVKININHNHNDK